MTLCIWVYNMYERRVYNGNTQKDNGVYNSVRHAKVCFQPLSVYIQCAIIIQDANHKRNVKSREQYCDKSTEKIKGKCMGGIPTPVGPHL